MVVARFTLRATHSGELMGLSPTGTAVAVEGSGIYRIAGGTIAEGWVYWDAPGLVRQLGLIPPTEELYDAAVLHQMEVVGA